MINLPLFVVHDFVVVVVVLDSVVNDVVVELVLFSVVNVEVVVPVLILSVVLNIITVVSCMNESGELIWIGVVEYTLFVDLLSEEFLKRSLHLFR